MSKKRRIWTACLWGAAVIGMLLLSRTINGQERPHYREFVLGSSLSSVSAQTAVTAADATVVHLRPALLQDLKWRLSYFTAGSNLPRADAVDQIVFSFYNDQLFRMVVDYDRERTRGMTDADMTAALSETYGPRLKPAPKPAAVASSGIDYRRQISSWGSHEYSVALLQSAFGDGYQVVVTSTALDALARTADAQAIRLDRSEAPQRAIEEQKKAAADARLAEEKARAANKAAFRP
jgi:hypothetical protein